MHKYDETIERAIVSWIKDELGCVVIAESQRVKAPRPEGVFATYALGASVKLGHDDMTFDEDEEIYQYDGIRKIPLFVTIYGEGGLFYASELRNSLEKRGLLDTLRTSGIHIARAFDIMDTSTLLETGYETRATIDIDLYVKESITEKLDWIETVELTKE